MCQTNQMRVFEGLSNLIGYYVRACVPPPIFSSASRQGTKRLTEAILPSHRALYTSIPLFVNLYVGVATMRISHTRNRTHSLKDFPSLKTQGSR